MAAHQLEAKQYNIAGIKITDEALFQIAFLSRGLPYYAHLLGRHSGLAATGRRSKIVKEDHVFNGLGAALQDVDQTITEAYLEATISDTI